MSGEDPGLGTALAHFLALHRGARRRRFRHGLPTFAAVAECADRIQALLPPSLASAKVEASLGKGRWAAVPWIAVLHPDETTTTRRGIYPVLLFNESDDAVEVTLAQGVTELDDELGHGDAVRVMRRRAERLAELLETSPVPRAGFALDNDFTLGTSTLAKDYVASTITHRRYTLEALPNAQLERRLGTLLTAYGQLLEAGVLREVGTPPPSARAAIFYAPIEELGSLQRRAKESLVTARVEPGPLSNGDVAIFAPDIDAVNGDQVLSEVYVARLRGRAGADLTAQVFARELDIPFAAPDLGNKARKAISAAEPGTVAVVPVLGSSLLEAYYNTDLRIRTRSSHGRLG